MNAQARPATGKKRPPSAKASEHAQNVLTRKQFVTSRLADFASPEELTREIGHGPDSWREVIVKELLDNALDACEGAGVPPKIEITVTADSITVQDNGGGMPTKVVKQILNYATRISSNAAYVSPTRGQQGNAWSTLIAMGHALTGKPGVTIIESRAVRHRITFTVDPIKRVPRLDHQTEEVADAGGTKVTIFVPVPEDDLAGLQGTSFEFSSVNPHAALSFVARRGDNDLSFKRRATAPTWNKWLPTDPTSAHWYDVAALTKLIAFEIDRANRSGSPQRPVRDFIGEFRGLASTVKRSQICEALNASRKSLDTYFKKGDSAVFRLLIAMQRESKPVKARDLGILGETHVLSVVGGGVSARYKRTEVDVDGVPYLIECAFAHRPTLAARTMICGLNWSASIGGDPFQYLASFDEGLGSLLANLHAGPREPICFFLHVASPRLLFLDRGKSDVDLPAEVETKIVEAVKHVTAAWTRQRKAEERDSAARLKRDDRLNASTKPMSIKAAAYEVMASAYAAASDDGTLPANARQVYYAARPDILQLAGVDTLDDNYFIQTLLIGYMSDHPDECAEWDVVFSDRGHFTEPHTKREIGLGTLAVRQYVKSYAKPKLIGGGFAGPNVTTSGPEGCYGGILYIEKEGFEPHLERAQIAERLDLAPASCKGMSVTAARQLVDQTCARFKIPLYILHDFDISGFSIATTLHTSNRRYQFDTASGDDFKVFDLGLRLADVNRLGLASERVNLDPKKAAAQRERLEINGATDAEIDFLMSGRRVELNAMTSRQFIDFLEAKLVEHGVRKVIPKADALKDAYRLFERGRRVKAAVDAALAAMATETVAVPADLLKRVRAYLAEHPAASWIEAVTIIAQGER